MIKSIIQVCDVHRLVDNDKTLREVYYCGICKAYICRDCHSNKLKRAKAMAIKLLKRK